MGVNSFMMGFPQFFGRGCAAEAEGVDKAITIGMAPVTVDGQASMDYGPQFQQTTTADGDPSSMIAFNSFDDDSNQFRTMIPFDTI